MVAELEAVIEAAHGLEQLEPSSEVWHRIQRRVGRRRRVSLAWLWAGAPAVAAAVLLLLLVPRHRQTPEYAAHGFGSSELTRERIESDMVREYSDYMAGIAEAIDECEAARRENPGNTAVMMAYLTARSNQTRALDLLTSGGE